MFTRELMITGLYKQGRLLSDLIDGLERRSELNEDEASQYRRQTRQLSLNLRKLRCLKQNYFAFNEAFNAQ